MRLERLDGPASLSGIVVVEVVGDAGNVDSLPAEQYADAADQVDAADDGAALAVDFLEGTNLRGASLSPQPDLRGRPLARCHARSVDGMVAQHLPAPFHQAAQQVAA